MRLYINVRLFKIEMKHFYARTRLNMKLNSCECIYNNEIKENNLL